MKHPISLLGILLTSIIYINCQAQSFEGKIAFYNVENLFDTIDDKRIDDNEFLPSSAKKWNSERYNTKIKNIGSVIQSIDPQNLPLFVGLCEVENKLVINDLITQSSLKNGDYKVIHQNSPDSRGIDVAAIYRAKQFQLTKYTYHRIQLPNHKKPSTRDILLVAGNIQKKYPVYILVNHWPSRVGGEEKSEPNRLTVANKVKQIYDSLQRANPSVPVIIMGDLNDNPSNKSVNEVLQADTLNWANSKTLVNLMAVKHQAKDGSYWYQNHWEMLDHIIVSKQALNKKNALWINENAKIHRDDFFLYQDKKGNKTPAKTYSGKSYHGGYSDHLPVFISIEIKKNND